MQAADLLVHAARQEPLGRVLLEAAACELPVMATDVGGTREIFGDGPSVVLVPPGDPGALADSLRVMLRESAAGHRQAEHLRRLERQAERAPAAPPEAVLQAAPEAPAEEVPEAAAPAVVVLAVPPRCILAFMG